MLCNQANIKMSNVIDLDNDDVVYSESSDFVGPTFKVSQLKTAVLSWSLGDTRYPATSRQRWFTPNGIKCQVLRVQGGGWQSGKLRFRLEFVPDEPEPSIKPVKPESLLDDLRSNLNI